MSYHGLEIDMLNLGDADSISLTHWSAGLPTRVLIDGGEASHYEQILEFLKGRGITYLNHIVCSHPHNDHAAGLIGIVNGIDFGQAWMHIPSHHIDLSVLRTTLSRSNATTVRETVLESLETQQNLAQAIWNRNKTILEPFAGQKIGFLTVCGPDETFYNEQLAQFTDVNKLNILQEKLDSYRRRSHYEAFLETKGSWGATYLVTEGVGLGEAPTGPVNESSTILGVAFDNQKFLFTADAGVNALSRAKNSYNLGQLYWMQIPHHGSRRNINEELISLFRPKLACVSAAGTTKHPRKKVVNAFKDAHAQVFSTHYPEPGGALWFSIGVVLPRSDYGLAIPLYDAE